MIPEIGHFSLILAFCFALVQGVLPLIGVAKNNQTLMGFAIPAARARSFCVSRFHFCVWIMRSLATISPCFMLHPTPTHTCHSLTV